MPVVVRRRATKNVVFDQMKALGDSIDARDFILQQGQILKRGAQENDAFLSRWVEVRPRYITYSKFQNTKVIDQIEIDELIGIATMGWQDDVADEHVDPNSSQHGSPRANAALSPGAPASFSKWGLENRRTPSKRARNSVFWRFKLDMIAEKKKAFVYKLGPYDVALFTSPIGFHRGRTFVFRCEDMENRERWCETISRLLNIRLEKPVKATTAFFNIRKRVRSTYIGDYCQIGVATLIGGNFMLNICQAQVSDQNENANAVFEFIDLGFTCIFTMELLVNIFATWMWEFIMDPWNWCILVFTELCVHACVAYTRAFVHAYHQVLTDLPGADVLRLMRCFRVFRLFKRIASLRKIMGALTKSLVPMANAFSIVCLVTAIYAIIGVTFFSEVAPQNYSSFFISFFSLFQSMTGDNWSEDCRTLMADQGPLVGIFYVSFMLLVSLVLVNVVIAVLLDAFGKASAEEPKQVPVEQDGGNDEDVRQEKCPFERIAQKLTGCHDISDLYGSIEDLWENIVNKGQIDNFTTSEHEMTYKQYHLLRRVLRCWRFGEPKQWVLSYAEFRRGIKMLQEYIPPLIISQHQYATHGLMMTALRRYQLREIHQAMVEENWHRKSVRALLMGTQGLLREDMQTQRAGRSANRLRAPPAQRALATKQEDPLNQLVLSMISNVKKLESRFQSFESTHARKNDQQREASEPPQETEVEGAAEKISAPKKLKKETSLISQKGGLALSESADNGALPAQSKAGTCATALSKAVTTTPSK